MTRVLLRLKRWCAPRATSRRVALARQRRVPQFRCPCYHLHTANAETPLVQRRRAGLLRCRDLADGDGVFIGPSDLSADLSHLGNPNAPEVVAAINGALDTIATAGKPSGIFAVNPADAKRYLARGVNFVAIASDINSMATSLRQTVSRFRP